MGKRQSVEYLIRGNMYPIISPSSSPSYGGNPQQTTYARTPKDQTSTAFEYFCPEMTSGAMYITVPMKPRTYWLLGVVSAEAP